jgi:arginine decarboxylase
VLFLINIGATQASIDYLMQVLLEMAAKFKYERRNQALNPAQASVALPEKRIFHPAFVPFEGGNYHASDIRRAYFAGVEDAHVDYVPLATDTLNQVAAGRQWVSASFVTPYPPGFPVIVPGQIITVEILNFFANIKVKEIHGFSFERGFKVFRDDYLVSLPLLRSTPIAHSP